MRCRIKQEYVKLHPNDFFSLFSLNPAFISFTPSVLMFHLSKPATRRRFRFSRDLASALLKQSPRGDCKRQLRARMPSKKVRRTTFMEKAEKKVC